MSDKGKTSIQVSKETKDRLDQIGHKGDTYDDIVRRLIDNHRKTIIKT